ncbi:MAG TPA: complex I subunit 1 family protein [Candidatus Acidoferrales bacterium]|nr:complex I subunit 1 family protein [Candidatus Acidoferrales bacterium]
MIVEALIAIVYAFVSALLLQGIRRIVVAHSQFRKGPSIFQNFYDFFKLMGKETLTPNVTSPLLFNIAPILSASSMIVAALIVPLASSQPAVGAGDLIFIIYLLTLPPIALILGGSASGSPYGAIGAAREVALLIAYETPFIISIITVAIVAGTFELSKLSQTAYITVLPLAAIAAIWTLPAAAGVPPFDIPEAETEIVSGPYIEYSGPNLALLKLGQWLKTFLYASLISAIFFGTTIYHFQEGLNFVIHFIIVAVLVTIFIAFWQATTGRMRVTRLLKYFWSIPITLAIAELVLYLAGVRYMTVINGLVGR